MEDLQPTHEHSTMQGDQTVSTEVITPDGDVILLIEDQSQGISQRFRCTRSMLRGNSRYLNVLFDPHKFREGISTEDRLTELGLEFGSLKDIPSHVLPVIQISDLPKISAKPSALKQLLVIVLSILCGINGRWAISEARAIEKLLQIALLAERLDALDAVRGWVEQHLKLLPMPKPKKETTVRQQLLLGMLMGNESYVEWSSAVLAVKGSKFWLQKEASEDFVDTAEKQAAWNLLPDGIEEELQARRNCVLETLSSIQTHFAMLYSSDIQCRKGLANSKDCDAFHLGQMLRFFTKRGTLHIGSVFNEKEADDYEGDVEDLIARLKYCPHYQLDQFHAHCGVRERMIPILKRIRPLDQLA